MAKRVTAIFATRNEAERAAESLVDLGADRSHISILSRAEERPIDAGPAAGAHAHEHVVEPARDVGDTGAPLTTTDEHDAAVGAGAGAVLGAIAGVAAGAAMLAVPGFGLIMAAGPLAWAIGGAVGATVGGAIAGGVYGGLRDLGIDEHRARGYEERIRGGGVLMTALLPDIDEGRVRDILREYNADDISFVDDTSTVATGYSAVDSTMAPPAASTTYPAGGVASASPAAPPVYPADQTSAPVAGTMRDTTSVAPPAAPGVVIESTTVASYETNIARGEAKQAEGEWRDRMADRTPSPVEDFAGKGEKAAGKVQEEAGEEEEVLEPRA